MNPVSESQGDVSSSELPVRFLREVRLADVLSGLGKPYLPRDGCELREEFEGEGFRYGGCVDGITLGWSVHVYGARFVMPLGSFPDIEVRVHRFHSYHPSGGGYRVTMESGRLGFWGPTDFYFHRDASLNRREDIVPKIRVWLEEFKQTPVR